MGRGIRGRGKDFDSTKGEKYFTRKELAEYSNEELESMTVEEAILYNFLKNETMLAFEYIGKGITFDHLESARRLIKLLK